MTANNHSLYDLIVQFVDSNEVKKCGNSLFVAADTFRGVITNEPGTAVEEDAAAAFSVGATIAAHADHALGWKLSGAGGGGYLILVRREDLPGALRIKIRRGAY